jgi:hypothetical protein
LHAAKGDLNLRAHITGNFPTRLRQPADMQAPNWRLHPTRATMNTTHLDGDELVELVARSIQLDPSAP